MIYFFVKTCNGSTTAVRELTGTINDGDISVFFGHYPSSVVRQSQVRTGKRDQRLGKSHVYVILVGTRRKKNLDLVGQWAPSVSIKSTNLRIEIFKVVGGGCILPIFCFSKILIMALYESFR